MTYFGRGTRTGRCLGRRLGFERLEQRDLLAVMRLMSWNSLNGPNDVVGDANFQTVFEAIGNETVAGNTKRVDILALQETDPAGSGGNSIGRIETILDTLYPTTNYASVISTEDGGGDSTGFVYDTSTVSLLESIEVEPETLTHHVLRGKFRPSDTLGESDFYVYSLHLKSGNTALDASTRAFEATVLRNDADALGEGAHVLFVGDFNMKNSFEGAWSNFMVSGAGQAQDVANAPGNWFDNPAFKSLHSQDPQIAMDDRFDLQLASGEFFNGVGLEYIDESFHVFGNNGTHTFDMPITTGTGASPAVLAALATASDHLPVVADYELLVSTPGVRITETLGGTKAIEGGQFDTYRVVLDTVPAANVSVTVTPDAQVDVGNGAGVAVVLTFTPENALTPQTIAVNAADDLAGEGNHTGLISHSSSSSDATYNGLEIADVAVMIVDNDASTIVINEIDSDQDSTDTMEFVELYDGGVGNASLAGKTVVFFNGSSDQAYAVFDLTGFSTDANGFFVLGNLGVPGVDLVFPGNTLQNGADAVALYVGAFSLGGAVTTTGLLDAVVYDTDDTVDPELLALLEAGQLQVNENSNANGTGHSLSRVPDGGAPRQTATFGAQSPTPGVLNQPPTSGVLIVHSGTRADIEEGGATDSYQIVLQTMPTADVMITVDPDDQSDVGAGAGVAIVLTFTPVHALIPQLVNVTAVDDAAAEGVHTSVITHTAVSGDGGYNGIAIANVVANVVDNDELAATSIVISEIMYNPASDEMSPGLGEWIEIINTGTTSIDLGGWMFDDEDDADWGAIPAGTILNAGQIAVFFDSALTTSATFRTEWSVPAGSLVVGITWGSLANSPSPENEILELRDNTAMLMDFVNFDDESPWPSVTGSGGPSIFLTNLSADNNDGANWGRSAAGLGGTVSPAGPTFSTADVGSPGRFFLPGDYNVNGAVDAADYVLWRKTLGSTTDLRADGSGPSVGVPDGVVDQFDRIYWMANFGYVGVSGGGGAGAGGGAGGGGELVAAATSRSAPPTASKFLVAAADNDLAVDSAKIEFAPPSLLVKPAKAAKRVAEFGSSTRATAPAGLLLLVGRSSLMARRFDGSPGELPGPPNEELAKVDEFFALLDESELMAGVEPF